MDDRRLDELIRNAGAPQRPSSAFEEQLLLRVQSEFVAESQPDDERDVPRIPLTIVNPATGGESGSSGHRGRRLLIAAAAVALIGGVAAGLVATTGSRVNQQLATAPEPEPPPTTNPVPVAPSSTAPSTTSPPPATVVAVEPLPEAGPLPAAEPLPEAGPLPAAETLDSMSGFCVETLPSVAAIADVTYHYGDRGEDIEATLLLLRSSVDELIAALDEVVDGGVDLGELFDDGQALDARLARLEAQAAAQRTNAVRGALPAIARDVVAIVSAVPGFDISQCSPIDSQEGSS